MAQSRLSVTVLGSGGPIADPLRTSSGYILAIDGKPRILLDAGGASLERIGRAGFDLTGLEHILLTHMHIDHSAGIAPVIMHLYMCERKRPIAITGPAGRAGNTIAPEYASPQPGAIEFVDLLFGPSGAWRYMNTFEGFATDVRETPSDTSNTAIHRLSVNRELEDLGVSISSVAVPHGMMPSVAFRVDCGGESVVYSGDISGSTLPFIALAKNATLLIHDFALPERDVPNGHLHAKPSAVGRTAQESGAKTLLVSHFMPAIEGELDAALDIVRHEYTGRIEVARDLQTYDLVT